MLQYSQFSSGSTVPYVKQSECMNFKNDNEKNLFQLFSQANKSSESLHLGVDENQSIAPVNYILDNQYSCEKGLKEARDIQTSQPGINFKGGHGWIAEKGWLIDNDSNLRQRKEQLTNPNVKNQLFQRMTLTTADLKKGYFDVDIDSVIKPGNFTTEQRPCGPLSGVSTLDKTLTPMIPKLKKEVQNTNYIIPEDSKNDWIRGGLPTREMVRNKDYLRRYQQKTA